MSLISDLADAITRQEGRILNNNPGNIWDGTNAQKPNRIWPSLPIDSRGFIIYPTLEAGRAEMENQLAIKIGRGETLSTIINAWDSGDSPATRATYVANVSSWTGLPTNVPLSQILDEITPFGSQDLEAGSIDWGLIAVLGIGMAALWLMVND